MTMLDDFFVRAMLAGIGIALAAGPLGCFVVWRRMAYFGDATAHAAVLGVALSIALSISLFAGVLITAIAMAVMVSSLSGRVFAIDTLLGVAAHSALALGVVAIALTGQPSIDLESYLFGEILAVSRIDLLVIWGGAVLVLALLGWRWSALLTATLSMELAHAEAIRPRFEQMVLTLALAILVAVAIKVVGALLVTAMLIIPAATARPFARTPEVMAVMAAGLAVMAVVLGLNAAYAWDTPGGPTIVATAAFGFIGATVTRRLITIR